MPITAEPMPTQRGRTAPRRHPGLNAIASPSTASAIALALTHSASCVCSFTDVTVPTPSATSPRAEHPRHDPRRRRGGIAAEQQRAA